MDVLEPRSRHQDPHGEVDQILETLRIEGAQRRNSTRLIRLTFAVIFALMLVEFVVDRSRGKPVDLGNMFIFASLLGGSCAYGLTPGLRNAVTQAAQFSDKRLLGGMIEALDAGDPKLKEVLENASADLLDQMTSGDCDLLDDYQLDQLLRGVRHSTNQRFRVAAIRAIGRIGTHRTLQSLDVFENDPSLPQRLRSQLEPHILAARGELRIRLTKERLASVDAELEVSRFHLTAS